MTVWAPAVDVRETNDEIQVTAELPGLAPEDVSVTVENGVLTISGVKKQEVQEGKEESNYYLYERRYGRFERSFSLPRMVNAEQEKERFDNRVLTVALPKAEPAKPIVPPKVAFYDMPDMVVNIQSPDGSPAYLKLGVSLELKSDKEEAGLKVVMPRIVDQFQSYLRELRVDDLRGSESVMRLKEELLRRINVAAKPYSVEDVLLKEMIVQ